jgi:hypothetical protein
MKKLSIYEPAMCCSTGLCGVGVDPELLRISTVLNKIKNDDGFVIERFNLTNSPQEFINNKVINDFINANGVDLLPAIVVDGEIVITGRYPSNDEFVNLLGLSTNVLGSKPRTVRAKIKRSGSCGCSGGNCC